MDRKRFFKEGIKELGKAAYKTPAGEWFDRRLHGFANMLDPQGLDSFEKRARESQKAESEETQFHAPAFPYGLPRPPGAAADFQKKCTQCGDCIIACPYGVLFHTQTGPVLDPNLEACRLCEDYPCIEACDEGALLPLANGTVPGFGTAIIDSDSCLNRPKQKQCKICVSECPIDGMVNRRGKEPEIEVCTGCGICVAECPTGAIGIVDSDIADRV